MLRFCPELLYRHPQKNAKTVRFRRYEPVGFPVLEKRHRHGAYWQVNSMQPYPEIVILSDSRSKEDLMLRDYWGKI